MIPRSIYTHIKEDLCVLQVSDALALGEAVLAPFLPSRCERVGAKGAAFWVACPGFSGSVAVRDAAGEVQGTFSRCQDLPGGEGEIATIALDALPFPTSGQERPIASPEDCSQCDDGVEAEDDTVPTETPAEPTEVPAADPPASAPRPLIPLDTIETGALDALVGTLRYFAGLLPVIELPEDLGEMDDAAVRQLAREIVVNPAVLEEWAKIEEEEAAAREAEERARNRPQVAVTDAAISEMTGRALSVLRASNDPPTIFARGTLLVRVCRDEKGILYIQEIGEAGLTGIFDRLIMWIRVTQKGDVRQDRPPRAVVQDALALPPAEWGVPPLSGVTSSPIFHPDGTILGAAGYDEQTRLYYAPDTGFILPPIPDTPTAEDVQAALRIVAEVFYDFPFCEPADRANAIGALLTAVLRPCIMGSVPLYLVDKPQAGSGAGLLQRAIGRIALGREPPLKTMPSGEEMRKEIFSTLRNGTRIQIFDNIEDRLSSPELASVLTAPTFCGRILGRSDEITLEVACFWMANGNNVLVGGDLARRTFKTRIDPQRSMPWQRDGFLHPDLLAWIDSTRGQILAACFTLARAWVRAGSPAPEKVPRVGSFEAWRDTIGGILEYVGVEGFMANADALYEEGDADRTQWEAFLAAIWGWTGCNPITAGALAHYLKSEDPARWRIIDALPDDLADEFEGRKSFSRVLGNAFARQNGRHFPGGYCLQRGKVEHKVQTWVVTYTGGLGGL